MKQKKLLLKTKAYNILNVLGQLPSLINKYAQVQNKGPLFKIKWKNQTNFVSERVALVKKIDLPS